MLKSNCNTGRNTKNFERGIKMATKKMLFVSEAKQKEEKVTVSARIDKEIYDSFQQAKLKAKNKGFELRITDICEKAIELAIEEVNKID